MQRIIFIGTSDRDTGLPLEAVTIAEVLKEQGYATGCFGKWHLGFTPPYFPTNQGFDEFRGLGSGDGDFFTHVDRSGNPDWWRDNTLTPEEGYTTDLVTRHSVDFIERHRDEPFFLYVPTHLDPPKNIPEIALTDARYDGRSKAVELREMHHGHLAAISYLDTQVGKVLNELDSLGMRENTIIVYFA